MEDLNRASLADVSDFFASHYAPNNAVLTIAGDFDPSAAQALVERYFGPIPANSTVPHASSTLLEATFGAEMRETVIDRVPVPRLYAACRVPAFGSASFAALQVAMDLLGAGRGRACIDRWCASSSWPRTCPPSPFQEWRCHRYL